MPDLPLGRIARIEVREAWPHEAHDFTPWLAEEAVGQEDCFR
jgi:hypothetical protein